MKARHLVGFGGRNATKLSNLAATLGDSASYRAFDLGDEGAVKSVLEDIGAFDHLVTTAAELTFAPVADLTTEQVKSMLVSKFWGRSTPPSTPLLISLKMALSHSFPAWQLIDQRLGHRLSRR